MATLTIRNVPTEIYEALTLRAKRRHRSINSETIFLLEQFLGKPQLDVEDELEEIRKIRESLPRVYVTEEELQFAKNEGRP